MLEGAEWLCETQLGNGLIDAGAETSDPATAISVKAGRKVVRAGSKVGFRIRTTNETRDRVGIWLGGRLLRKFKVGPTAKTVSWKAPKKLAGRQIRLRFKPKNGPARIIKLRVTRR